MPWVPTFTRRCTPIRSTPGSRPRRGYSMYIFEDVPCSLVPIAGSAISTAWTRTIHAMVRLANIHGKDYWREGRTIERLGIKSMSGPGRIAT